MIICLGQLQARQISHTKRVRSVVKSISQLRRQCELAKAAKASIVARGRSEVAASLKAEPKAFSGVCAGLHRRHRRG